MDLFLLVPSDVHSARVAAAARFDRRSLRFDSIQAFDRWDDLLEARLRTARVVVIDPFMAGEDLASVRHLVERLPSSGVIGYADFGNHRPEVLWRLEAMGLAGVIGFGLDDNPAQFWRALFRAASAGPLSRLLIDLRRHLPDPMVYGIVRHILESAIERESVQEVAQQLGIPARTCRRLLKAAGLPPPHGG